MTPSSAVNRSKCHRAFAMAVAVLALGSCGGNPAGPTPAPGDTFFGVIPNALVLGPGDAVQVYGIAAANPDAPTKDVTASMRLSSANPAVARIQGTTVIGVAPGETDITATYQALTSKARTTVFAPAAVVSLKLLGVGDTVPPCWPNDHVEFLAIAVLADGSEVRPAPATWSSTSPDVAPVDANGFVSCASPGSTTIRATYQGQSASVTVTVRVPQDTVEYRGGGTTGPVVRGGTVTVSDYGFYVLASAGAATIRQRIFDADGTEIAAGSSLTVSRGSGPWTLKTTFTVPATAVQVCSRVTMEVAGTAPRTPARSGGCALVQ